MCLCHLVIIVNIEFKVIPVSRKKCKYIKVRLSFLRIKFKITNMKKASKDMHAFD